MKRVFLNADDFGKRPDANQAIDDAMKQGLVCSAGLIVTGRYLQDAVGYIENGDYWDKIHLHVNLSRLVRFVDPEDKPLSERMKRCSLFCSEGLFRVYKGLPKHISNIRSWRAAYDEIAAQYEFFKTISHGKGNLEHLDFHLWYNLTWPVSFALKLFTRKYHIKSVRYIGVHQEKSSRFRFFRWISFDRKVRTCPSTNIDYYLTNRKYFDSFPDIELYCHPDYIGGEFVDNSSSYCGHERKALREHIAMLRKCDGLTFVSWKDE